MSENVEPQVIPLENSPIAFVNGQAVLNLPPDLYIPPDALEVFLEAFEGPLDLLLYLIKKQNVDVLNIPIAEITRQYMEYVEVMKEIHLELAAEYLVMAAMLAEIKSRMLLPRIVSQEGEEEDPRAELVRRLQEYERFKKATEDVDSLPRLERDNFIAQVELPELKHERPLPEVNLKELLFALKDILQRAELRASHQVQRESLSIRERMSIILSKLQGETFVPFERFFTPGEGRLGVVVTFVAMLELIKGSILEIVQSEAFGPIHLKARTVNHEGN